MFFRILNSSLSRARYIHLCLQQASMCVICVNAHSVVREITIESPFLENHVIASLVFSPLKKIAKFVASKPY